VRQLAGSNKPNAYTPRYYRYHWEVVVPPPCTKLQNKVYIPLRGLPLSNDHSVLSVGGTFSYNMIVRTMCGWEAARCYQNLTTRRRVWGSGTFLELRLYFVHIRSHSSIRSPESVCPGPHVVRIHHASTTSTPGPT
jgi:hypothetical protein